MKHRTPTAAQMRMCSPAWGELQRMVVTGDPAKVDLPCPPGQWLKRGRPVLDGSRRGDLPP